MELLQQVWNGLASMMVLISSGPVSLPFTGLLPVGLVECARVARTFLTESGTAHELRKEWIKCLLD